MQTDQTPAAPEKTHADRVKNFLTRRLHSVIHQNDSPHRIALGMGVGLFIGFLPIMGIQMMTVLLLSLVFRKLNKIAALAGVQVTNYFTAIPVYSFVYWVGVHIYKVDGTPGYAEMKRAVSFIMSMGSWTEQVRAVLAMGVDMAAPLFIGGAVVGLIAGALSYRPTKQLVEKYRRINDRRSSVEQEVTIPENSWEPPSGDKLVS